MMSDGIETKAGTMWHQYDIIQAAHEVRVEQAAASIRRHRRRRPRPVKELVGTRRGRVILAR